MARAASVTDALVQITVTFAWVHLTGDTSFITIALLCFSSLTVVNAILNLLVRAVVKSRSGETLSQRIHERIVEGNVIEAMKNSAHPSQSHHTSGPSTRFKEILSSENNVKEVELKNIL